MLKTYVRVNRADKEYKEATEKTPELCDICLGKGKEIYGENPTKKECRYCLGVGLLYWVETDENCRTDREVMMIDDGIWNNIPF